MKLVIPVAGRGTRLGKYELPKGLLPVNGRPIVFGIIDYWKDCIDEVIIIVSSVNSNTYKTYFEKYFKGQALFNDQMAHVSLFYLVRPLGMRLEYNWIKIHKLLREAQIVFKSDSFGDYEIYNANSLTDFMLAKYEDDIFWTLMENSKEEVLLKLSELGRCFKQEDFEADVSDA